MKNSLKKIVALLLSFIMFVGIMPIDMVMAVGAIGDSFGTLSAITEGGYVENASSENATVIYENGTVLEWAAKDDTIGRTKDGWWVGVKMTAPSELLTKEDLENASLRISNGSQPGEKLSFWECQDSDANAESTTRYVTLWGLVNEEKLNDSIANKKPIKFVWQFDWDGDGEYEQNATLIINNEGIVLMKNGIAVYPSEVNNGIVSVESEHLKLDTNNNSSVVNISSNPDSVIKYEVDEANAENNGWYLRIKVSAPEFMTDNGQLSKIAYQVQDGKVWSGAKSFSENGLNYIVLTEKIDDAMLRNANSSIKFGYRFDWNADGTYEQLINVIIRPEDITLINENGGRVFPGYGIITNNTSGKVSGEENNIVITIESTSLDWSEKDLSTGKTDNAWWTGATIEAPAFSDDVLGKATYQVNDGEKWSESKFFFESKNNNSNTMNLWISLTQEIVDEANESGDDITRAYRFDWDGNGEFEQTVTFKVVPSDDIVLNKVEQRGFTFEQESPKDQWVGETFMNKAIGGNGIGAVTYEIVDGYDCADIDEETGEVTFYSIGTVTVRATKKGDSVYKDAYAEYTVTAIKYPQTGFRFETSGPVIIVYEDGKTYINEAIDGNGDGEVTYEIVRGEELAQIDTFSGEVTIIKAGSVHIVATKQADDNYEEATAEYTLNIQKAQQVELCFEELPENNQIVYSEKEYVNIISAKGGNGEGEIVYSLVDGEDVAVLTENDEIITLKSGEFTIRAEKAGDECYEDAEPIEVTITVVKAEQETFSFKDGEEIEVTYNQNDNMYLNEAVDGESEGEITYSVESGDDVVTVDEVTGEVTILKSGTAVISATKAEDDKYETATISYEITVNKAQQSFEFEYGNYVTRYYGTTEFENYIVNISDVESPDGKGYGDGEFVFTIEGDEIGAEIDENGKITFGDSELKVGTITVTVVKRADDCYEEYSDSYDLTIAYVDASNENCEIEGETLNESGWYVDNVKIYAPEGFEISYENNISTSDWAEYVEFDEEGINSTTVYLMNSEGEMTDGIAIEDIMIDKVDPHDVDITYSVSLLDAVLEGITFGIYNAPVTVTLIATNEVSGIDNMTYDLGEGENVVYSSEFDISDDGKVEYSFVIEPEYRNSVTMTATAVSGRSVSFDGEKVLVIDTTNPEIFVSYEYQSEEHKSNNNIIYTQGSVNLYVEIAEDNFDISEEPEVTINDDEVYPEWNYDEENEVFVAEFEVSQEGQNNLSIRMQDIAGNESETYTQLIVIDATVPVVTISYDNDDAENEIFFNKARTMKILVEDDNFDAERFNFEVTSVNVAEEENDVEFDYNEYLHNINNWIKTDEGYEANVTFDVDGRYSITINCVDFVDNEMDEINDEFVIDMTEPANIEIEYSEPVIEKVLEAIMFGYYQAKAEVTITAEDETAGIEYFEWQYTREDEASESNTESTEFEEIREVEYSEDGKISTARFEIPENARGYVTVRAYDRAMNESEVTDSDRISITDEIAPQVEVEYAGEGNVRYVDEEMNDVETFEAGERAYFDGKVTARITIDEANFEDGKEAEDGVIHEVGILVIKTDKEGNETRTEYLPAGAEQKYEDAETEEISWETDGDKHSIEIEYAEEGDYVLVVEYADLSGNESLITGRDGNEGTKTYESKVITIDETDPIIEITWSHNEEEQVKQEIDGREYISESTTATIKVTEHNFRADEIKTEVTAVDVTGAEVEIEDYAAYLADRNNWEQDGDEYTATIEFNVDANYTFDISYNDIIGHEYDDYKEKLFTVDKTVPQNLNIEYSEEINFWEKVLNTVTFGFYSYNPELNVTITAEDITSGTDYFTWKYVKEDGTSDVNVEEISGTISADEIEYSEDRMTAEAHFTIKASDDEQFRGYIEYAAYDRSYNMKSQSDNKRINIIDTISPDRTVEFEPDRIMYADTLADVPENRYDESINNNIILYHKNSAKVTFRITEANFYAEDVAIKVNDEQVDVGEWSQDNDTWTSTYVITENGDYVITMEYTDRSNNEMVSYTSPKISVDDEKPVITVEFDPEEATANEMYFNRSRKAFITVVEHNFVADDVIATITAKDAANMNIASEQINEIKEYISNRSSWKHDGDVHTTEISFNEDAKYEFSIDYKDIVGNKAERFVADKFVIDKVAPTNLEIIYSEEVKPIDNILKSVSFGYYNPSVTVTLKSLDQVAGIDYIEWSYTREENASDINVESLNGTIVSSEIEYGADNKHATATFTLTGINYGDIQQYRGNVAFKVYDRATNTSDRTGERILVVDTISPTRTVTYSPAQQVVDASTLNTLTEYNYEGEDTNAILYYDDDVTVTVRINEANFYTSDVLLLDNNNKINNVVWSNNGDEWTSNIVISSEGDHVISMKYIDRSNNAMTNYESQKIVIDRTNPQLAVEYSNDGELMNAFDGREYYDANRTATITITEHNFRADDVETIVKAVDSAENDVQSAFNFNAYLKDRNNWATSGDVHTAIIPFDVDANYTFDIEYKDLANRKTTDYVEDMFTVDKVNPESLNVDYSTSVFETILEKITFGFYNAKMSVIISAYDYTAGVYKFDYNYVKTEGTSNKNVELLNDIIESASITRDGNKFTTKFDLPRDILDGNHQFDGTVNFIAYDRSERNSGMEDKTRIIVDNIAPTATISFNEPIRDTGSVRYYTEDINATIVIDEANFYKEDVRISVTRNGSIYPVHTEWVNNSVDVHTGTFALREEGDYIVNIAYSDRSENKMQDYKSVQLTVDRIAPVVTVSNIEANSANKDDVYGFTIKAEDINIDIDTFNPVLTAVVRNENGNYMTKDVPLGTMHTVVNGRTYSYIVDNLEEDAVYTLKCLVSDMAGNIYDKFLLDDNVEYESVQFSVNRNGSTFIADEYTGTVIDNFYIYNVDSDIVIYEINVDPVTTYRVMLNDKDLTEGSGFTTSITSNDGEWSKRTYVIDKSLFETETEYNIVIESVDKTETRAFSDVKNLKIAFVVDKTAPVLSITGLEEGGRYQVEEEEVTITPTDDGGLLYSLKAVVLDSKGNALKNSAGEDVSVKFEKEGDDFINYLNEHDGVVKFSIPEGLENKVQIICTDHAKKNDGTTNVTEMNFNRVTVSQSGWVIFYANKLFFYSSIALVVLVIAAAVFLSSRRNKKAAKKKKKQF